MKDKLLLIWKHLKPENLQKMWLQSKWIWQYGKRYWKSMVVYTLLGIAGSGVSLVSSFISKDLIDIITGHQTGKLLSTFAAMIGFSIANILFSQASTYASTFINLKVDSEIKNDIFAKMLVTDWESLTDYHTGDLVTRWSSDASNISSGILNWIPNLVIYIFRFISALFVVLYYDPTFALFALIGIPFSAILSKPLLRRMSNNNAKSAAMNAKMYGFNQETFSNIQTIKAFDLIHFYIERLKSLQKEYIQMRMDFQKMSMLTSILMTLIGFIVSYSCYGWGIYRVWSNAITYGTMTMFLSLSGTLTSSVNSLAGLVPSAVSLTISAGRLMDIVEMPQEDYSRDSEVRAFENTYRAGGIGLDMQELSYRYNTGTEVFSHATVEAYPHEIVALVGPSGEGKTTMIRLILGLIHPEKGEAYLRASNGKQVEMNADTRHLFAYVPQGNTILSGTIAENLKMVKQDATEEEMIEALKISCAWDFVKNMEETIYTKIGERGRGFSEGQAQRIAIARAVLRDAPILLLDEATSALDVTTERKVLRNIIKQRPNKTCIVTTHRPSVLNMCQRVYRVMETQVTELSEEESSKMAMDF